MCAVRDIVLRSTDIIPVVEDCGLFDYYRVHALQPRGKTRKVPLSWLLRVEKSAVYE
jgi:hypothetical protein